MTNQLFLFASVADVAVAFTTDELEAVVHLGEIVPTARTAPYVLGLAALRSRVLTIIDARARITGLRSTIGDRPPLAIVTQLEGHSYGLLIDEVSDICAVEGGVTPLRGRVDDEWVPFAKGVVMHDNLAHLALALHDFTRYQPAALAA